MPPRAAIASIRQPASSVPMRLSSTRSVCRLREEELARAAAPRGHRDAAAALGALAGGALAEDESGYPDEDGEGDDGEVDDGWFHLASRRVRRPSQPEKACSAPDSSVNDPV